MNPILIDLPMPIRTPRLLVRPTQPGDGAMTAAAIAETWDSLNRWMLWADDLASHDAESQEIRARKVAASFLLREEINLLGFPLRADGQAGAEPVVWTGFHHLDWSGRQCETGYWVRQTAQSLGYATEATNALLRYAFGPMGMRRVGIAHAAGNQGSRRVIEKLGFLPEGVQRKPWRCPADAWRTGSCTPG